MGNPYEDYKQERGLIKYFCNKCKYKMSEVRFDATSGAKEDLMAMFTKVAKGSPDAFYCTHNKCDRFGLLTKVAIKK